MKTIFLSTTALALLGSQAFAQNVFPSDYDDTCGIDATVLGTWFESGTPTNNGLVNPADGFDFPPSSTNTNCDFYQWGAQMFLWLTTPNSSGSYTFDGTDFYDAVTTQGGYAFKRNSGDEANLMQLRGLKAEDIQGTGQAGGGDVLISQEGSLAYYGIHTNDIYANYLTGQKAGAFASTSIAENFPTTEADMGIIETYLNRTFNNPSAMTMELKTSWVDASTVTTKADYLTISAVVPSFEKTSDTLWTLTGTKEMELAMVGMHIAAPVKGHPELVWSSFEHINNAPNASYYYYDTTKSVKTNTFNAMGNWTFFPSTAAGDTPPTQPASVQSVAKHNSDGNIVVTQGATAIVAVDVVQENPWGMSPVSTTSDAIDTGVVNSNTDLVSLNATLLTQLAALDDVRANYYQIGGIWTADGQLPTGDSDTNIRGGDRLANSTLETFHQYPDTNNDF